MPDKRYISELRKTVYEINFRPEWRSILGEDAVYELDEQLRTLTIGDYVQCSFYSSYEKTYIDGIFEQLLGYERQIQISGRRINIRDIIGITVQ